MAGDLSSIGVYRPELMPRFSLLGTETGCQTFDPHSGPGLRRGIPALPPWQNLTGQFVDRWLRFNVKEVRHNLLHGQTCEASSKSDRTAAAEAVRTPGRRVCPHVVSQYGNNGRGRVLPGSRVCDHEPGV